jgi:2'-5' RNA ligase
MAQSAKHRDIGVAIGIPEPYTSELQGWRERLGDPNAAQIPPHVTLLPPTTLHGDQLSEVEEHLLAVAGRHEPFLMHLRGSGTFRPISPVVFVTLVQGISECELLEADVRRGPLHREIAFPYHPHVTVAHDVPDRQLDAAYDRLADFNARFRVWGFTLFEHGADGHWRPQRDFPFAGAEVGPAPA